MSNNISHVMFILFLQQSIIINNKITLTILVDYRSLIAEFLQRRRVTEMGAYSIAQQSITPCELNLKIVSQSCMWHV